MARVLKWVAGVLVVLLVLAVGGLLLLDSGRTGAWAAERLSAAMGRKVAIQDFDIQWGLPPRVVVTGITVENAPWGTDPLMARIERAEAVVRLAPLLRGKLDLPEVTVTKPWVLLEKNQDGEANWSFNDNQAAGAAAEAATPDNRHEMPVIGKLAVLDGQLLFRDPKKGVDVDSKVNTVAGSGGGGEQRVQVEGTGNLEGKPFRVNLSAGSLLSLRETDAPYPVDLSLAAGETTAKLQGTFKDPVKLQGADLRLTAEGPSLAEIFPLFGIPMPDTNPYQVTGLVRREQGLWEVRDLKGKVGETDLSGWLSYEPKDPRPMIRGELKSEKLRFADLGGLVGFTAGPKEDPFADGKLIPDGAINTDRLKAADMDLTFTGGNVQVPILPLEEVHFRTRLENGKVTMEPVQFTAEVGKVAGRIMLDASRETPVSHFDLAIQGLGLRPFFKGTRFEDETKGTIRGKVDIKGSGKSLADIMGNADGGMVMVMEGGQVSHLLVEAAGLDVAEALGDLIGGDEPVGVRCMVADFKVNDGVMKSETFVFDTTDTNIAADMTIGLKKETLAGRIEAEPKDPSPLSANTPITFGGTFLSPKLGVDGEGLVAKGAAAVALGTLLTPLAAIIPFIEEGGGEDSPCRSMVRSASTKNDKPAGSRSTDEPAEGSAEADRENAKASSGKDGDKDGKGNKDAGSDRLEGGSGSGNGRDPEENDPTDTDSADNETGGANSKNSGSGKSGGKGG